MARKWFRLHLSTAIVLMVVAAVLLWLNFCNYEVGRTGSVQHWDFGWPRFCVFGYQDVRSLGDPVEYYVDKWAVTCNTTAVLGTILSVGGLVEFIARRIVAGRSPIAEDGAAKRGRFRLHLSTALMLVLLAGGLLGLNIVPQDRAYNLRMGVSSPNRLMYAETGWPLTFRRVESRPLTPDEYTLAAERQYSDSFPCQGEGGFFNSAYLIHNVCFALGFAVLLVSVCEIAIHRRESKLR